MRILFHFKNKRQCVFLFFFESKTNMESITKNYPWPFNNRNPILQPWQSTLNFNLNSATCIPIWMKLHNLNLYLWRQKSLGKISADIGRLSTLMDSQLNKKGSNMPRVEINEYFVPLNVINPWP
uniref:DUF4283 domain-containing protein n=1 Tax=Kalanchoe fedtschenkoi TaxID=63787 RepID=A0A7N0UF03_KALFE